ncbi:DNA-3-methyladenine glycosylase [Alkalibacterium putridalgicola]|nr:DNA-3-methyladenine glycosylase [Alkalibacterium putridalgicola]SEM17400.1 DNA-3-methyladenine glycosylase [Alkalibacterium putridalgicola]
MSFLTDPTLSTVEIAEQLLGCLLVKEVDGVITSGHIVETEAYVGIEDQASHSYNSRKTPRMTAMYEPAGTIYIYKMHTHLMLNVVTKDKGDPQAVLIRAIEPHAGTQLMEERRQKQGVEATSGPGKLTKAMGIAMDDHETSILKPSLYIDTHEKKSPVSIERSKRIGIPNKGEWTDALLRFTVKGNPYLSRKKGQVRVDNGWDAMLD